MVSTRGKRVVYKDDFILSGDEAEGQSNQRIDVSHVHAPS